MKEVRYKLAIALERKKQDQRLSLLFLRAFYVLSLATAVLFFASCATIPKGVKAVEGFDKNRYLGKWYEIARFDFRYEKDLNNTTASYSIDNDGSIKVVNRGYNYVTREWKQVNGKAKFVGADTVAMLKVSFFGPFYGGYNVIALDKDYKYALVAGQSFDYLWILARETTIPDSVKQNYVKLADSLGFKTSDLIWVEHNQ